MTVYCFQRRARSTADGDRERFPTSHNRTSFPPAAPRPICACNYASATASSCCGALSLDRSTEAAVQRPTPTDASSSGEATVPGGVDY